METFVITTGVVLTGLHAGLLYDFAIDTVPSMKKLDAKEHIRMFQAIDKTITNALFFPSFVGPILLLPAATYMFRNEPAFPWLIAASLIQIILCNGVTISQHLPLNAELAKVKTTSLSDAEAEKIRQDFQGNGSKWNRFHTVRTLAGITAFSIATYALTLA